MAKAVGHIEIEVEDDVLKEMVKNLPLGAREEGERPKTVEAVLEFSDFGGQVRFTTKEE